MTSDLADARSWWQDDPARRDLEIEAMNVAAPNLEWIAPDRAPSGGWLGTVPLWPFDRAEPEGLSELMGQPLRVAVVCGHAFPMVEPAFSPEVDLPTESLGWAKWHVAPDGSLCLLQATSQWDPHCPAAELIPKVSGWYLEFVLLSRGLIEAMTERGIASDDSLDQLIAQAATCV